MREKPDDQFDAEETARRRDEVIRRMANTPPQHRKAKAPTRRRKSGKRAGVGRAHRKPAAAGKAT